MFIVFVQYLGANQGHNPPSPFLLKNKIEKRKQKKTTCSITQFARSNVQFYPPNIPLIYMVVHVTCVQKNAKSIPECYPPNNGVPKD